MRRPPVQVTMPMVRRAQALRDAGLSVEAAHRVIKLDYGDAPNPHTLRKYTYGHGHGSAQLSKPSLDNLTGP